MTRKRGQSVSSAGSFLVCCSYAYNKSIYKGTHAGQRIIKYTGLYMRGSRRAMIYATGAYQGGRRIWEESAKEMEAGEEEAAEAEVVPLVHQTSETILPSRHRCQSNAMETDSS